jgi:DNA polymerase I-like protein with 3'-5' exonuclease and polymerase domains
MPCIELSGSIPSNLNAFDSYQVYNCLDSCITAQLVEPMLAKANPNHLRTYEREMRLQSLCLEMSSKGFPVNRWAMLEFIHELEQQAARALKILGKFCEAVYHAAINPNSPLQVAAFFYDFLDIPTVWVYDHKTKQRKRGTDRATLEKLRSTYPLAAPFVNAIIAFREPTKLAGVFKKGLEPSGVLRCNFSPSGTETGRLSSQANPYGRGTNAQNLADRVRAVVEAPTGYCLAYIDLKTAESFAVGYLSGSRPYIDACSGGDLHTAVSRLTWTDLGWNGDRRYDRAIADRIFYRDFSYRDMAKRAGHGTNYYGQPENVASHVKVDKGLIEEFQQKYFKAFPEIPEWHLRTIAELQQTSRLVTPLGRERMFWGRPSDKATWREAIAHVPQSLVGDVMNEGLMQVQAWILKEKLDVSLLAQVHDAGLFLLPTRDIDWLLPELLQRIVFPVDFGDLGVMSIPADAAVGRNWAKCKPDKNPSGLRDWSPGTELHFD